MAEDAKTPIMLTHDRAFCPIHGEPYRADYPRGYPTAMVMLAAAVLEDDRTPRDLRALCGQTEDELAGDPVLFNRQVEALLDAVPACCRIRPGKLREIYIETVAKPARCSVCHRKGPGTPFKTVQRNFAHVCVDCVLERLQGAS